MKIRYCALILLVGVSVARAGKPLKQTQRELHVKVYQDKSSLHRDFVKTFRNDGVAVAALAKKSGQVELRFREKLTANETFIGTFMNIHGVVDNVRLTPSWVTSDGERYYEFLIDPKHLSGVSFRLDSRGTGKEGGDLRRWRTFRLRKNENKAVESARE